MIREHWRAPSFWHWYWRREVPVTAKAALLGAFVLALLVGGYFAAGGLNGASAAGSSSYVLETTITKVVTVREHGKLLVKKVPVVLRRVVHRQA